MNPPTILKPGKLDDINRYLLKRTGCFAFLIPDRNWHYSEPKTGKGAVELWSIALYAIYHDCGCRYLDFILDSSNEPNTGMDDLLYKCRRHKRTIERVLRTNIAHGVFDSYSSSEMKRIFFARENRPLELEQITDDKWSRVAEKIRRESDELVQAIYKWADEYQKSDCNIREIFGSSDSFKKSIDTRIMFETLDNDFCGHGKRRAKRILEDVSKQAPNEKLELWGNEISSLFLSNEIKTPTEIIDKLRSYLFDIHNPIQQSSITIGESLGFSLSSLL